MSLKLTDVDLSEAAIDSFLYHGNLVVCKKTRLEIYDPLLDFTLINLFKFNFQIRHAYLVDSNHCILLITSDSKIIAMYQNHPFSDSFFAVYFNKILVSSIDNYNDPAFKHPDQILFNNLFSLIHINTKKLDYTIEDFCSIDLESLPTSTDSNNGTLFLNGIARSDVLPERISQISIDKVMMISQLFTFNIGIRNFKEDTSSGSYFLLDHLVTSMIELIDDVFLIFSNKIYLFCLAENFQFDEKINKEEIDENLFELHSFDNIISHAFRISNNKLILTDKTGDLIQLKIHIHQNILKKITLENLGKLTIANSILKLNHAPNMFFASSLTSNSVIFSLESSNKKPLSNGKTKLKIIAILKNNKFSKMKFNQLSNKLRSITLSEDLSTSIMCFSDSSFSSIVKTVTNYYKECSYEFDIPPYCMSLSNCSDHIVCLRDIKDQIKLYDTNKRCFAESESLLNLLKFDLLDIVGNVIIKYNQVILLEGQSEIHSLKLKEKVINFDVAKDYIVLFTESVCYLISYNMRKLEIKCAMPFDGGVEFLKISDNGSKLIIIKDKELFSLTYDTNFNYKKDAYILPNSSVLSVEILNENYFALSTLDKDIYFYEFHLPAIEKCSLKSKTDIELMSLMKVNENTLVGFNPQYSILIILEDDKTIKKHSLFSTADSIKLLVQSPTTLITATANSKIKVIELHHAPKSTMSLHISGPIYNLRLIKGYSNEYLVCNNNSKLLLIDCTKLKELDDYQLPNIQKIELIKYPGVKEQCEPKTDFSIVVLCQERKSMNSDQLSPVILKNFTIDINEKLQYEETININLENPELLRNDENELFILDYKRQFKLSFSNEKAKVNRKWCLSLAGLSIFYPPGNTVFKNIFKLSNDRYGFIDAKGIFNFLIESSFHDDQLIAIQSSSQTFNKLVYLSVDLFADIRGNELNIYIASYGFIHLVACLKLPCDIESVVPLRDDVVTYSDLLFEFKKGDICLIITKFESTRLLSLDEDVVFDTANLKIDKPILECS